MHGARMRMTVFLCLASCFYWVCIRAIVVLRCSFAIILNWQITPAVRCFIIMSSEPQSELDDELDVFISRYSGSECFDDNVDMEDLLINGK